MRVPSVTASCDNGAWPKGWIRSARLRVRVRVRIRVRVKVRVRVIIRTYHLRTFTANYNNDTWLKGWIRGRVRDGNRVRVRKRNRG